MELGRIETGSFIRWYTAKEDQAEETETGISQRVVYTAVHVTDRLQLEEKRNRWVITGIHRKAEPVEEIESFWEENFY